MSITCQISKSLKSFASCQKGATSVIFALAAIPLFGAMGLAVDYSLSSKAQTEIQVSLDTATLAGAASEKLSDAKRVEIANAAFQSNIDPKYRAAATFVVKDGFLNASANVEVPTTFMKLLGFDKVEFSVENSVNITNSKSAEIALVLDYSGSMNDAIGGTRKYISMQKAVNGLLSELKNLKKGKAKVGLVPFSHQVYTTMPKDFVLGQTGPGNWTGCTVDRLSPFNTLASTPLKDDDTTKWGQAQYKDPNPSQQHATSCKPYVDNKLVVAPVTADLEAISSRIDVMKPHAWTHIALGVEFGYHLLTPNAPYGSDLAKLKDEETLKYMVVLTDGMQTERGYGAGQAQTINNAERNLETLCKNAKADGITIVTVAFDLDDSDTRKRLKSCASDGDANFHVVDSGSQLSAAFSTITTQIAQNIYLNK